MAADRLIKDMDAGANYNNAVLRCIFGLDAAYSPLEDDRLRDEVEEKIIFPLEENLRFYFDKSSVEDCL